MNKLKAKLFFLASINAFAFASLFLMLFNYNPYKSDPSVFVIFYFALLLFLTCTITFVILFVKSRFIEKLEPETLWPVVRVSFFVALIVSVLFLLQGLKILDLWVGVPLALAIFLLELFFRGNKYKKS